MEPLEVVAGPETVAREASAEDARLPAEVIGDPDGSGRVLLLDVGAEAGLIVEGRDEGAQLVAG